VTVRVSDHVALNNFILLIKEILSCFHLKFEKTENKTGGAFNLIERRHLDEM
jgi:hypothetical protein